MANSQAQTVEIMRFANARAVPWKRDEDCGADNSGSGSSVFRASRDDQLFAVKDITFDASVQWTGRSRVGCPVPEIEWLRVCNHKNVVNYVAAYMNNQISDHIYLVMQPWVGMNLFRFLTNSSARPQTWAQPGDVYEKCGLIFSGLLSGLEYLHENGIFHKDIKPENILLYGDHPIITDFGISKLYRLGIDTNYTVSTPNYLAPEQIAHKSSTQKSDVFAMGCCLLCVLFVAVAGGSGFDVIDQILRFADPGCQYGSPITLHKLLGALQMQARCMTGWENISLSLLVRDMLVNDPVKRPTSQQLVAFFAKIDRITITNNSIVRFPSRHLDLLSATFFAEEFQDQTICVLGAVSAQEDIFPQNGPTQVYRVFIPKGDNSTEGTFVVASLDHASPVNLMSPVFAAYLSEQGHQLQYTAVGTSPFTHSGICTLRYGFKELSCSFQLLDGAKTEAYFDILLGHDAVQRLFHSDGRLDPVHKRLIV